MISLSLPLALLLGASPSPSFEATLRQADAVVVYPASGPYSAPLGQFAERLSTDRLVRALTDAEAQGLDSRVPLVMLGGPAINTLARRMFVPPPGLTLARDGFIVDDQTWTDDETIVLWSMRAEGGAYRSILLPASLAALTHLDAVEASFGHGFCVLEHGRAVSCGSLGPAPRVDVPRQVISTSSGKGMLDHTPPLPTRAASSRPPPPQTAPTAGAPQAMRSPRDPLRDVREGRLRNIRQLTFGGENAEAYYSPDGLMLVLQSTHPPYECDQIFVMPVATGEQRLISTGRGRTTCAYYVPSPLQIIFSSTHHVDPGCPPTPDYSRGYVWPLYGYDIFTVRPDGTGIRALTDEPGYDAEATVSNDGQRIVFTSTRDGDLDIYTMAIDGSDVRRVTNTLGYDGGAFYSPDDTRLVYRAHHPRDPETIDRYRKLLAEGLIEPRQLDIMIVDVDGSNVRQVTDNGAANFDPYWHPDGERIIFSSNMHDERGRNFDLYLIREDGTDLERITWVDTFDGFPMFSPDGRQLVFASNRNSVERGETNVFVADWVP